MIDSAPGRGIRASIDGGLRLKTPDEDVVIFDIGLDSFSKSGSLKAVSLGSPV
jgi:hypothetical protein